MTGVQTCALPIYDEDDRTSSWGWGSKEDKVTYTYEVQTKRFSGSSWSSMGGYSDEWSASLAFDRIDDSKYKHVRIVQKEYKSGKVVAVLGFR